MTLFPYSAFGYADQFSVLNHLPQYVTIRLVYGLLLGKVSSATYAWFTFLLHRANLFLDVNGCLTNVL